jgi:hypothetical protein
LCAEDSDWVEVGLVPRDMQPHDMLKLTAAGFAQT